MTRRRRMLAAAVVGALLQLTAGLATAAQVVVCRAPGHVAIESVLDGDCCPAVEPAADAREVRADACAGCLDTPLLQAGLSSASRTPLDAPAPAPVWSVVARGWRHAAPAAPPRPPERAFRDRTVVLLI